MEDKIDIHSTDRRYETGIKRLDSDTSIHTKNKELIHSFLWDCKIGKTVKGRAKKKIGKRRLLKYLYTLKNLARWLKKPFDEVSQEEMEKFISDIEDNVYKNGDKNYAEQTKLDFKKTLNKFYKWLGRSNLIEFMDMSPVDKEVPALTREEVEKLVNSTPDIFLKAAIMVLFDGGARAEEFFNLKMMDLTQKKYKDGISFWINIRYSKTFSRTIPLPLCGKYLKEWIATHPEKYNNGAQLFCISYPAFRKRLRKLADKVLGKH